MKKVYGETGVLLIISDKQLNEYLADGYTEEKPVFKKESNKK